MSGNRLDALTVREKDGKSYWTRIGVAFPGNDGSYIVRLDAVPASTDGQYVIHLREPREQGSRPTPQRDSGGRSYGQDTGRGRDDDGDQVPF